ncbi:Antitoxin component YwqK of the YwqJK toxin-antitoxin module [Flavobacterium urocaniciphilum]|uniref:Antitoxin component YwqK of the YwqJK toxin-antitoxin module n=2 Tax=Flavobacterium urocaniciphilum TaxID=1299341 RepID=A0A1H9DZD2_9FLAO|nr:Antitoxin component YwqK of the YwqJK toxin-antitoxin module [Flavobacterium urocaniciphilum]
MKLLVMRMLMELYTLKTNLMRKYIFIQLFFISLFSHSQNWESNGYVNSDVSIPRIRQAETFFYTEYEFLLNVNHKTLTEIEAEIKSNTFEQIKYITTKTNQNSIKVEKYIKGNIFSEKTYKNNVLNGVTKIFYPDGTIFQEVDFVNGKVNGLYKIYSNDRDHKVILETNYKNGIRNGIRKYFIPREDEVLEGNYVDGNLVGDLKFSTEYGYYLLPNDLKKGKVQGFSNNKLISEFYIINEKDIHGEATIYFYDVNKVAMKIPYYLGEKNGTARMYDRDGKEINKIEYKHDKKVGDYINYTKDKQVSSEEHYDDEGNRTGTWKEYKNGLIYSEQSYKNNKLDGAYKLYKNGVLQNVEEYKNGIRNGKSENFNVENGQLISESVYKNDVSIKAIQYYNNQAKFSVFEKDEKTNLFCTRYYDKTGKLLHQNNYNETRQPIGIQKNFLLRNDEAYSNSETHYDSKGKQTKHIYIFGGNSSTETNYRNGVPHGEKIMTNKDNVKTIEYYYESKGNSKKVTKEEFESLVKAEKK